MFSPLLQEISGNYIKRYERLNNNNITVCFISVSHRTTSILSTHIILPMDTQY